MAYHRHDAFEEGPGYHGAEEDHKYSSSRYSLDQDPFSAGYHSREADKEEEDMTEFERQVEEEQKPKYQKEEEKDTAKRAAAQIRSSEVPENKLQNTKSAKSIEDAIEKAVKEEKEVVHLD